MKAMIEMRANEFTVDVFDRIKSFIANQKNATLCISIEELPVFPKESKEEYFAQLDKSIKEAEEGKVVRFTMEEFETYVREMINE